jgi:hypothetical protein
MYKEPSIISGPGATIQSESNFGPADYRHLGVAPSTGMRSS